FRPPGLEGLASALQALLAVNVVATAFRCRNSKLSAIAQSAGGLRDERRSHTKTPSHEVRPWNRTNTVLRCGLDALVRAWRTRASAPVPPGARATRVETCAAPLSDRGRAG